jgi:hypothetical protein
VRHDPPLHEAGVHGSGSEHSLLFVHCKQVPPLQYEEPPLQLLAVRHVPPLHSPGVHSSGGEQSELLTHCAQVPPLQ